MKIEILCPELCNLYGDMGNIDYLKASLGSEAEFVETKLTDRPAFADTDVDMIYIGSMTEKSQERMIAMLEPFKARVEELIKKGSVILATGNGQEIFYDRIEVEDGTVIKGLGVVPYHAKRKLRERNNSLYLGTFDANGKELEIVGYTSRFTFSYDINAAEGMFKNVKGTGNEPASKVEGFRKNNLIGTNLLGPILILNPDFTKYIIELLGSNAEPAFYEAAKKAYDVRLTEFHNNIDFGTHC